METQFVYVTAANEAEAMHVAKTVVKERLAACANLLGAIKSVYWWEGELCEGEEVALVLKTSSTQKETLIDRVKQLHSYECPCIICLPIPGGNPEFLKWIDAETKE